jgi:hypothetical protein
MAAASAKFDGEYADKKNLNAIPGPDALSAASHH